MNNCKRIPTVAVYGMAFTALIIWASSYSVVYIALKSISPLNLAFLRLTIGAISLLLYALVIRMPIPQPKYWGKLILIGLIGFSVYLVLLNTGQRTVGAGTSSFVIAITPVITAALAYLFLRENLRVYAWIGVLLSCLGVFLIIVGRGEYSSLGVSFGLLMLLCAATVHSVHFLLQKTTLRGLSPLQVTLIPICIGALILLPFSTEPLYLLFHLPGKTIAAILFLGIFPSAIAHLMWAYVVKHMPVSIATSMMMFIAPMATLVGVLWLGEAVNIITLLGGALIITGVIFVQNQFIRKDSKVSERSKIKY